MSELLQAKTLTQEEYADALLQLTLTGSEKKSFLHAPFFGAWQEAAGRTVLYFAVTKKKSMICCGLAIRYDTNAGQNYFYCPYGPLVETWSDELYTCLVSFFSTIARQHNSMFVRLDSPSLHSLTNVRPAPLAVAATASLQPRAEWVLDISPDEDIILAGMHKHTRYGIRNALRKGCRVSICTPREAPIDTFYEIMVETGARDGFSIFSKEYYRAALESLSDQEGFVAICYVGDVAAAASLFVLFDGQAHYAFSGSTTEHRKIAPSYLLLWEAMVEARRRECSLFNFGGIQDDVKGLHLENVTSFKKRFGGVAVHHPRPVDIVYAPIRYRLFSLYKFLQRSLKNR